MNKIEINYWQLSQYIHHLKNIQHGLQHVLNDSYVQEIHFLQSKSSSSMYLAKLYQLLVRIAHQLAVVLSKTISNLESVNQLFQLTEYTWITSLK